MVRVPDQNRFELRLMDGAANPYIIQAGMLVAGLDGVENNRDPGDPLDINMYEAGPDSDAVKNAKHLPLSLLDSLRLFGQSKELRAGFGDGFVDPYVRMKLEEWQRYTAHLSDWEREHTFDC
jgi:glutamine synthetase